jgi:7-cyano-7-deazaguanine synthase
MIYQATREGQRVRALYFDMGTFPTNQELHSVKAITFDLGVPLEIVDVKGIIPLVRGYLPEGAIGPDEADMKDLEALVVPASGFPILLSVALYYAQLTKIETISVAVLKEQAQARPRMREFFEAFPQVANLVNFEGGAVPRFQTPFIDKRKTDVVSLGSEIGARFGDTWTCRLGGPVHCGTCSACRHRKRAFDEAGVADAVTFAQ